MSAAFTTLRTTLERLGRMPRLGLHRAGPQPALHLKDQASAPLRQLLVCAPEPFILMPQNLLIYWSPRSACTKILVWYLAQTSLLYAADFYSGWPHDFRMNVLFPSKRYGIWRERIDPKKTKAVRFVRHPDRRAVSSYRHLLAIGNKALTPHHRALSVRLRRPVDAARGFTFLEYLDYCRASMGWAFDIHHRIQAHPLETQIPPSKVVRLETDDLVSVLNGLAAAHTLPVTEIETNETFIRVAAHHRAKPDEAQSDAPVDDVALSAHEALNAWPDPERFLTPAARTKIRTVYAEDFQRYYPEDADGAV